MCVSESPCTAMLRYFLKFRSKLSQPVMNTFTSAYSTIKCEVIEKTSQNASDG